jgi:uroporphyrin-3 C-methyltransferase
MADNQDKLTQSDQQKLAALEEQLSKNTDDKATTTKTSASVEAKPTQAAPFSKREEYVPQRSAAKAKTGFLWFVTLLNLLLVLTLAAAAYWGWMQWQSQQTQQLQGQQQQQEFISRQQSSYASQQAELTRAAANNQLIKDEWQGQNQALQDNMAALVTNIEQNRQQVALNQAKLEDIAQRRPADWLLAEADYLLKMAGRKLWLEHDINTAMMMLQATDTRLQELEDPSLLPVREKLAADMQSLQQINPITPTSVALNLSALIQQVDGLPLAFFKGPDDEVSTTTLSNNVDDWKSNLMANIQSVLKDFFSVKKITTEVKPFMSEQQQWLAKEQLKFTLLSAQIAMLQENTELYQDALGNAQNMLAEHFDGQNVAVVQFKDSLSELLNTDVKRVYPDQFSASAPLQDLMNRRLDGRFTNGNR